MIRDLAVILAIAGVVTLVFQKIRQPVVLGYIIAGIIVGPHTPPFPLVTDLPNINTLAELGVIFLMFGLGLEFSFRKLLRAGTSAGITAVLEVVFMFLCGFGTGRMLGWSILDSIFLGSMLSMSSTTIIIKALDELGFKTRRFAEVVFGILIVEDLAAILLLVALTTLVSSGSLSGLILAKSVIKLALVVGSWLLCGFFIVPRFIRYVGTFRSDEMLAVVSVGLCLLLVAIAAQFHYSAALGAFLMGSILGESTESHRIEELIKPVRDIFAAIFFVSVGMLIDPVALWQYKGAVLLITLVTVAGKLFITSLGPLLTGQPLKTSILIGFSLAQIGEFSFIIATLGLSLNAISAFLYPVIVCVSLITTFTTPYLIRIAPRVADSVGAMLPDRVNRILERGIASRSRPGTATGPARNRMKEAARWSIPAFIVILVNVAVVEYLLPVIQQTLESHWASSAAWAVSMVISAPFIWAMLAAFGSGAALLSRILTLVLLGAVGLFYFRARYVGVVTIIAVVTLFSRHPRLLARRMEALYGWFERGFLSGVNPGEKTARAQAGAESPAAWPWAEHLVRVRVHPDAVAAGKTLRELALRKTFGVSIVAIQRGSRAMVAPGASQQIFPKDELLLLGTDEQIEQVRTAIESPAAGTTPPASLEYYELRTVQVTRDSSFCGRSIRHSGLREGYGAMVVGIDRQGRRITNPDSETVIEADDLLSIVGESGQLDRLQQAHDAMTAGGKATPHAPP